MPLQEAIVFGKNANLVNPCGVGFGTPCVSAASDEEAWKRAIPRMRETLQRGDAIGLLVQTRNGRVWDSKARNPKFNYKEDYLVAAYSLSEALGNPWTPGMMIEDWVTLFAFGRAARGQGGTNYTPVDGMVPQFQCSPAGCRLTRTGPITLMRSFEKSGKTRGEAMSQTMFEMKSPTKKKATMGGGDGWTGGRYPAGWRGGNFSGGNPSIVRAAPVMGLDRPPNYQAPTPPVGK